MRFALQRGSSRVGNEADVMSRTGVVRAKPRLGVLAHRSKALGNFVDPDLTIWRRVEDEVALRNEVCDNFIVMR
uniref:Uncharacterized protein n=1 Tax=Vespula pensylvanica TaxID=30213 RepID=A0A834KCZ7_VESPE|nr:hypothetical protein H0235_014969 [Vespula pensylvanica]